MNKLGLRSISSVGCGCGTLEWLIQVGRGCPRIPRILRMFTLFQAGTGVSVTGYEVNRIWWEGAHSTPHYIDMGLYIYLYIGYIYM